MGNLKSPRITGTTIPNSSKRGVNRVTTITSTRTLADIIPAAKKQSTQLPAAGGVVTLTSADYERAAKSLGTDVAFVKAVAHVESRGSGFLTNGRPKILFEAHLFSKLTAHKHDKDKSDIRSRKWNKSLYKGGPKEYTRLQSAMELNRDAALKSASWGKFQILGSHYHRLGYKSVDAFVADMFHSEGKQLDAFVAFIKTDAKLLKAAVKKDWSSFAAIYNGPGYKKNKYDAAMEHAYEKYLEEEKKQESSLKQNSPSATNVPAITIKEGQGAAQSYKLSTSDFVIKPETSS